MVRNKLSRRIGRGYLGFCLACVAAVSSPALVAAGTGNGNGNGNVGNFNGNGNTGNDNGNFNSGNSNGNGNSGSGLGNGNIGDSVGNEDDAGPSHHPSLRHLNGREVRPHWRRRWRDM